MISRKTSIFVFLMLSFGAFVFSHHSRKHEDYSFKDLREAVNGDSLTSEDQQRLFNSLNFLNCSENKPGPDYRKCFTPKDLHDFDGSSQAKALNSTEFEMISPVIVFCLLPAREQNSGKQPCDVYPTNHSELFNVFANNFTEGKQVITQEALGRILEELNKTIGQFLTKKKCFSAGSIIKEVKEEGKTLDQQDFEKACASIILHLVQGYCIEKGPGHNETESKLPSKEFFINDIFGEKTHLFERDLEEIMESLDIGKSSSSDGHSNHDNHNHRRRRSAAADSLPELESIASHAVHRRAVDPHGSHTHSHEINGTCYSLDDMLSIFDVDRSIGSDRYDFQQLCPAFIQQAKSGACNAQSEKIANEESKDLVKIWGYGLAAVTLITLTSLAGVATIPIMGKRLYKKVLDMLVGLAVGSLAADSLLHLLPHSFGLHAHEHEGSTGDSHADHSEESNAFIWKAVVVLASIYTFYLFEILMRLGLRKIGSNNGSHSHVNLQLPGNSSKFDDHKGASIFQKSNNEVPTATRDVVLTNMNAKGELENHANGVTSGHERKTLKGDLQPQRSGFSDDKGKSNTLKNISAVAWMIIIGDSLHNISDGLAIGAVFSQGGSSGISGGISTSIAVFCHELPHELGDFAVLLKAGMPVKMALLANLLSAMSCYIGLIIGIEVGQQGEVRLWFFAIAGGIFLYVALVDMLPNLMHSETLQAEPLVTFVLQNVGLLLGFGILLIIALYEENLRTIEF